MISQAAVERDRFADESRPDDMDRSELDQEVDAMRAFLLATEQRAATLSELTSLMSEGCDPLELAQRCAELAARATHAAGSFIYLWNPQLDRLVLRVATDGWQRSLISRIQLRIGEGLTGWSALMRQTVVVDSDPLADPRAAYFPELREDPYRSMIAVSIHHADGDVLGVFSLYALTEGAFTEADVKLANEVGALLASGLMQAETLSRLRTHSAVSRFLADLPAEAYLSLDQCLYMVAERITSHLDAEACMIELTERPGDTPAEPTVFLRREYARQNYVESDTRPDRSELAALAQRDGLRQLRIPLGSVNPIGAVTCHRRWRFSDEDVELAEAISAQAAAAVMSMLRCTDPVIDQLLEPSDANTIERTLKGLGWQPGPTHIFAVQTHISPSADMGHARHAREELGRLANEYPGSILVSGGQDDLLFLSASTGSPPPDQEIATRLLSLSTSGIRLTAGMGPIAMTGPMLHPSLQHALTASRWAGLAGNDGILVKYADIAHLRLLPGIALAASAELRAVIDALAGLVTYDLEHGTELARTLDVFMTNRGSVARTAKQLFVHRNTLRQRMRRIEEITGQCPDEFDNWQTAGLAARMIEKSREELAQHRADDAPRCPTGVVSVGQSCCSLPGRCVLKHGTARGVAGQSSTSSLHANGGRSTNVNGTLAGLAGSPAARALPIDPKRTA